MKKFAPLLAVAIMAVPTLSFAASMAGANTVNSAAIVDGSIATADIANKAVTGAKIADATITDAKISGTISTSKLPIGTTATTVAAGNHSHVIGTAQLADGAVTAGKLAAGAVGAGALTTGAVTTNALADGAVTDAKISGIISAAKLGSHSHAPSDILAPGTLFVHTGAADGVTYFNTISAAMAAVSSSNYSYTTIKILSGNFIENIDLNKYVILEGNGTGYTWITGTVNGGSGTSRPVKFRNLTVNGNIFSYGEVDLDNVTVNGFASNAFGTMKISNSTVNGDVGSMVSVKIENSKIVNGSLNFYSYAPMNSYARDVEVTPVPDSMYAVYVSNSANPLNISGSTSLTNVTVTNKNARQGLHLSQGVSVKATDSTFLGSEYGIGFASYNELRLTNSIVLGGIAALSAYQAQAARLINSQVIGAIPQDFGVKVVYCYDGDFNSIANQ